MFKLRTSRRLNSKKKFCGGQRPPCGGVTSRTRPAQLTANFMHPQRNNKKKGTPWRSTAPWRHQRHARGSSRMAEKTQSNSHSATRFLTQPPLPPSAHPSMRLTHPFFLMGAMQCGYETDAAAAVGNGIPVRPNGSESSMFPCQ